MSKLQIYKASAGSGKTYLLTLFYLKEAFKSPDNFKKILAVTFTNKAADEMKSRILEQLKDIENNGKNAEYYEEIFKIGIFDSETEVIERAKLVKSNILHDYSFFSVSTIDSFVQKVIKSFSFEMNLNSSYELEFDTEKVITDLTEKLFENISEDADLRKWLIKFAESKTEENADWNFRKDIKELASEIFKENFLQYYKTGIKKQDKKYLSTFLAELFEIKSGFEKKINDLSRRYSELLQKVTIKDTELPGNFKTVARHFTKKIPAGKFDEFTKTLLKAREGAENLYAKSSPEHVKTFIKEEFYPEASEILEDFFKTTENDIEKYYSATEILKNFHSFGIINDLAEYLPEYRKENNILLISDTTLLLKEIIGNNDAPFIYEKTGNRYENILIDEFQDTSGFQWANFKPLIQNSISNNNKSLIVGDIKQSIYRWRNGNWRLLHSRVKKDIGDIFTEEKTLDTNFRSKENIIKFNNAVFTALPEIIQNEFNGKISESGKLDEKTNISNIITSVYSEATQKIPENKNTKGGAVRILFYDKKSFQENLKQKLPEIINKMLTEENKNPKDIGILVRTNRQAKEITQILTEYQHLSDEHKKYGIISGDSLYIENSRAVRILISAIKYIYNPADDINTVNLVFEYTQNENKNIDLNEIFLTAKKQEYKDFLPERFINNLKELRNLNLFVLSEKLISAFNLDKKTGEFPYLKSFQDLIYDFSKKTGSDIGDFIEYWENNGKQKSLTPSDKLNAVNVMTIHKSKGLAFDTVIIPFSDFNLDGKANSTIIWTKTKVKPFDKLNIIPLKYSKRLGKTVFADEYYNEMLYSYIDALNLLYVAFTRAKNELYCFSAYTENKKQNASVNNISQALYSLRNKNITYRVGESAINFSFGNYYDKNSNEIDFSAGHNFTCDKETEETEKFGYPEQKYPAYPFEDKIKIKLSSKDFFIESIPEIKAKVNYGILMHEIFKNIKTTDDVEKSLKKYLSEGILSLNEYKNFKTKFSGIMSNEKIKKWFDGTYEILNEEEILTGKGDKKIPDKVLLSENELIVIDFKFGEYHKKYESQIIEYKQLLKEIYDRKKIKAYIFFPDKNKIIEIN